MAVHDIRTDVHVAPEPRASAATAVLIVLVMALMGIAGYDAYLHGQAALVQRQAAEAAESNRQTQQQLQETIDRAVQNDASAQATPASEQERAMWAAIARASAAAASVRPFTVEGLQRAVFRSTDAPMRVLLRDYLKVPENLERVSEVAVFVAGLIEPSPSVRRIAGACQPLFAGLLPDAGPANPDALPCYEFLKRREAEGGDVAAWQKLLEAASGGLAKKN